MTESTHPKEIELLRKAFPKYENIRFFKEGATRRLYIAEWGPGKEQRIIKVDKEVLESLTSVRHAERGYDTANDLEALAKIKDPEKHSLIRLCDFGKLEDGRTVSVESFFDSESLEEKVQNKGPLKTKEFDRAFTLVLEAVGYLNHTVGLYHRDIKPSNILIGNNNEIRLTDLVNACDRTKPVPKFLSTAGGHLITAPWIMGPFTGEEAAYDEKAEMYEIGASMFFSLTGKYMFDYNPNTGKAVDFNGKNLLNEEGKADWSKHEESLEEALRLLPNGAKKYSTVIRRLLTTDEEKRYSSIDELIKDFERAKHPLITSRRVGIGLLAGAALTAVMTALYAFGVIGEKEPERVMNLDPLISYNLCQESDIKVIMEDPLVDIYYKMIAVRGMKGNEYWVMTMNARDPSKTKFFSITINGNPTVLTDEQYNRLFLDEEHVTRQTESGIYFGTTEPKGLTKRIHHAAQRYSPKGGHFEKLLEAVIFTNLLDTKYRQQYIDSGCSGLTLLPDYICEQYGHDMSDESLENGDWIDLTCEYLKDLLIQGKGDVNKALIAYYNHHLYKNDTNDWYYPYEAKKSRTKIEDLRYLRVDKEDNWNITKYEKYIKDPAIRFFVRQANILAAENMDPGDL